MTSDLKVGDVVQISPDAPDSFFGGCFMLVTEPKPWGAQGFVAMPIQRGTPPQRAYARIEHRYMELVGRAHWVPADEVDDAEAG